MYFVSNKVISIFGTNFDFFDVSHHFRIFFGWFSHYFSIFGDFAFCLCSIPGWYFKIYVNIDQFHGISYTVYIFIFWSSLFQIHSGECPNVFKRVSGPGCGIWRYFLCKNRLAWKGSYSSLEGSVSRRTRGGSPGVRKQFPKPEDLEATDSKRNNPNERQLRIPSERS